MSTAPNIDLNQVAGYISNLAVNVEAARQNISRLAPDVISEGLRDSINRFQNSYRNYQDVKITSTPNWRIKKIRALVSTARAISSRIQAQRGLDGETKNLGPEIARNAEAITSIVGEELRPFKDYETDTTQKSLARHFNETIGKIDALRLEQERSDELMRKRMADNEAQLSLYKQSVEATNLKAEEILAKTLDTYNAAVANIDKSKSEIDKLLGHASGRVIAGDYEKSAASEKFTADLLRIISVVLMLCIVLILGYSYLETVQGDFDWKKASFRILIAILISAPAAYLARESNKHRAQQYHHLQASLDLKAMNPYLASLPADVQHRIKSEVATRLFAGRDLTNVTSDSYPINAHELAMELIKQLGASRAASDASGKSP